MIDKKELRIGNIIRMEGIQNDIDNKAFVVTGMGPTGDTIWGKYKFPNNNDPGVMDSNEVPAYQRFCEGMPITEEWLTKFGFKEWSEGNWKIEVENANVDFEEINYYLPYKSLNVHIGELEMKYVHQLQNIYYIFTGKELNY